MPKPQGTYLKVQSKDRIRHRAQESNRLFNRSPDDDMSRYYEALRRVSDEEIDAWHRDIAAIIDDIKNNEPSSREDKIRKRVAKVFGEVRKILEKTKDAKKLEVGIQVNHKPIISAPARFEADPSFAILGLCIAMLHVLEIWIRIRGRTPSRH
jgi:DNA-binding transcriptional regulator PaaX